MPLPDLEAMTLGELKIAAAALRLAVEVLESAGHDAAAVYAAAVYVEADRQAFTLAVTVPLAAAPAEGAA